MEAQAGDGSAATPRAANRSIKPSGNALAAPNFSSLSFLIVDDQPYSRRLIRSILVGFGSREVYESGNGVEGIELARSTQPSIIITDIVMPVSSGLRFIAMMKATDEPTAHIPIIVLSGYLTKSAALAVTESGADELLVKPVSPKVLYEHISRLVLRRSPRDARTRLLKGLDTRTELPPITTANVTLL